MITDCVYCGNKGTWWCLCKCCDDKFMVCNDCGEDIPEIDTPMNSMEKDKYV